MRKLLLILVCSLMVPAASATVTNSTVDGYTVTMRRQPSTVSAGEEATLTFTIRDRNGTRLQHEGVYLSIRGNGQEQFSTSTLQTNAQGQFTVNYLFATPGTYSIEIGFKPQNRFLSTSFESKVVGIHTQRRETDSLLIIIAITALTVGYVIGLAREFRNPEL
ncbi:MAG: filamin/ABP280 repeat domain-containing protein [Candidatus Nanohaloarchaea archaeon]|nr:filamin/ABP280 repeat domain-containing protein [Candidatus Nanohaloarchaea archaeon]